MDYLATKPKIGLSYIDIAEINDAYQCTGLIYNYDNVKTFRLLIVIYCKVISNKKKISAFNVKWCFKEEMAYFTINRQYSDN